MLFLDPQAQEIHKLEKKKKKRNDMAKYEILRSLMLPVFESVCAVLYNNDIS